MEAHPNHLMLERFATKDLAAQQRQPIAAHLETCESCAHFVQASVQEQEALLTFKPAAKFVAEVLTEARDVPRLPSWLLRFAGALAVSVFLVLLALPRLRGSQDEVRFKGAPLSVRMQRGAEVAAFSGERVRVGDRFELTFRGLGGARLTVWTLDDGVLSVFHDVTIPLHSAEYTLADTIAISAPCRHATLLWTTSDDPDHLAKIIRQRIVNRNDDPPWPKLVQTVPLLCEK